MTTICDDLRKAVLQAAIQGKLTEQLPEDGNAEDLYKEIQAEKQRLIKEGKIKKEKPLPPITEDDIPFDIPENWKWVRLGEIFNVRSAMRIHQSDWRNKGIPFFRGRELVELSKTGDVNPEIYLDVSFYEELKTKGGVPNKDDILISAVGTLGKTYVVQGTKPFYYKDAYILCLENYSKVDARFIKYLLDSPSSQNYIKEDSLAVTVAQLTILKTNAMNLPLPPLAEQKRIVARVDELMVRIDEMEKTEKDIKALYEAFPGDMKASLLQAAIQGKLTEQLPEDGNAEDLYKEIQAEKQRLIKEGKIRKEKPLPEIVEEDIPFDIPESWKWMRFGEVVNIVSARRVHQADWKTSGIPFYRAREIAKLANNGYVDNDLFISKELYSKFSESGVPKPGDLMVTAVGTLGKTYIVQSSDVFYYKDASVICLENRFGLNSKYLKYIMESDMLLQQITSNSSGTTVATLTMERMVRYVIPLPPLAEQERIVEKLDQLLPLCDSMKSDISGGEST